MILKIIEKYRKIMEREYRKCHNIKKELFCKKCGRIILFESDQEFCIDEHCNKKDQLCGICNYERFIIKDTCDYAIMYIDKTNTLDFYVKSNITDMYSLYAYIKFFSMECTICREKENIDLNVIVYSSFFQGA